MTHETKKALKAELFKGFRREAVDELQALVKDASIKVEDTEESIKATADYALRNADKPGERGAAIMAAAKWTHGFLEETTYCKAAKLEEMIAAEVKAASKDKEAHTAEATK